MKQNIGFALTSIAALTAASIATYTRFSAPELTETQLMLHFWSQWWLYAFIAVALFGAWLSRRD